MKTAPMWITCRVNIKALEASVAAYIEAREKAGKQPLKEDVMHIIEQHTEFGDLRPREEKSDDNPRS